MKKKPAIRCAWASNELSIRYHDEEWGSPLHDDRKLFEFLILEGAQAGLSWDTILKKRENYRAAFDSFDPRRVAAYDRQKIQSLLRDAGIVRNRLKINSAVQNAKAFLKVQAEFAQSAPTRPVVTSHASTAAANANHQPGTTWNTQIAGRKPAAIAAQPAMP